jgi:D-amino-acid dehydrogenase
MLTPSQSEPWNTPGILPKVIGWLGRDDAPVLLRPAALGSMFFWGLRFLFNSSSKRFHANARSNARLARFSLAAIQELRQKESLDYGQVCQGSLKIYRDQAAFDEGASLAMHLAGSGVTPNILDPAGTLRVEPSLQETAANLVGAIHFPDDESGDAHRFCAALALKLFQKGVEIRANVEAMGFVLAGQRASALQTSAGDMQADGFVLAAGIHAPALAAGVGLKLPIQPVKGYSITVPMTGSGVMPHMPVVDDERHVAMTPMDGLLRVAGTAEFAGFDLSVTPARIENLKQVVGEVFPRYVPGPNAEVRAWAGLRPYCCDGVPIIGCAHVANVYINAGHGHLGWTLAAGSGKLLSQLVSGQAPEIDPAPYSPLRF